MRLLLIRQGQSVGNAEGRLQGHLDIPLSERGRQESERLAERLSRLSIDALYASPLSRARQTAELVAARTGLELIERPALMERDVGALAGLTREEIVARFPEYEQIRTTGEPPVAIAGYELDETFGRRVRLGLEEIIGGHAGQTVVALTHGGVIASFCRETLELPHTRPGPFALSNTGVSIFDVRDGDDGPSWRPRVHLITLNDTCHLDGL